MKENINILVITGGFSNEKELSLISGEDVVKALLKENKNVQVLEITNDKKMVLYRDSILFIERKNIVNNIKIKKFDTLNFFVLQEYNFDVAFLALHGNFGEDGQIQALLDLVNIPYTGSGIMASSIGMNKSKCYEYVSRYNINIPEYFIIFKSNYHLDEVFIKIKETFGFPCVIKPNDAGSSIGVTLPTSKNELNTSLIEAFNYSTIVIVQKFIKGREFACGVLGNTTSPELEVLPVAESIIKDFGIFSNYQKYYSNEVEEICPAKIENSLKDIIMKTSESIHRILGCDGLSRSDFRYDEKNGKLYFLEINTSPGHTENSICPQEARSLGITFGEFILKQINLALNKKEFYLMNESK